MSTFFQSAVNSGGDNWWGVTRSEMPGPPVCGGSAPPAAPGASAAPAGGAAPPHHGPQLFVPNANDNTGPHKHSHNHVCFVVVLQRFPAFRSSQQLWKCVQRWLQSYDAGQPSANGYRLHHRHKSFRSFKPQEESFGGDTHGC